MDPSHGMVAGDLTGDFDHELVHFSDNPEWGVWWGVGSGDHLAALPEDWHSWTVSDPADDSFMLNTEINGHLLPERGLVGDVLGHYADFEEAATGIVVGELRGTFDPTALGWEAVQTGVFLQTSKFLAMSRTQTGRQKLEKLDIPSIEVGRANLSGNNGNLLVNMDNVTYFAYANGAPPKIWATEDVHGAFVNLPNSSDMVLLSGSGLSAKFTVKKWHSGHWMAKIHNGQGTYAGPGSMNGRFINFYGGAAGKYKFSNKIFWGTGSGVTK
jgi:hypothetical protein